MDTRAEDLTLLRQVNDKLQQIEYKAKAISAKESQLKEWQNKIMDPGYYQTLPTDNGASAISEIQKQCTSEKSKIERFVFIISLVLNLCVFAFTIVWLIYAPKDAWIHQIDSFECFLFWVGHCILGLFVALLPAIAYTKSKETM